MTSLEGELRRISAEQNNLSLKCQQLLERKKMLCVFQELRNRMECGQTDKAASDQQETDSIDDKLRELGERKAELNHEKCVKKVEFNVTNQTTVTQEPAPAINIFYVEPPPSTPAPKVILEIEKFPPYPCRTQCPDCRQYVMTETYSSVSSLTWMACVMTALIGCVAGCCLIPFCTDRFKSTNHKCPKCRTLITTVKKL